MNSTRAYPGILSALLLILLLVVLQLAIGLAIVIVKLILKLEMNALLLGAVNIFSIGIVILIGMYRARLSVAQLFRLPRPSILLYISILVAGFGLSTAMSEVDNLFRYFYAPPAFIEEIFMKIFSQSGILSGLFLLSVVAPFTEEILFRGIFLRGFLKNYRPLTAVLVSSFLFALIHLNPWQFAGAAVTGVFLAIVYIKTGSIIPCIFGHAVYNGIPFLIVRVFHLKIQGYSEMSTASGTFQPLWLDLSALALIAAGMLLFYFAVNDNDIADEDVESEFVG